jgi:hypothetical protein
MHLMASDPKLTPSNKDTTGVSYKGIRIFKYPKVIFMFPTMLVALICGIGMTMIHDETRDPTKVPTGGAVITAQGEQVEVLTPAERHKRFTTPQNLLAVLFLGTLTFNLVILGLDFPRFTVVAIILLVLFLVFFLLWIGAYFDYDLMKPLRQIAGSIYAFANHEFYFMIAGILATIFAIIFLTRWLDYWEVQPNEILHHHGPLSDLERFPTMNLKFDKEIPDVFEFLLLGAGRLVLHMADERKSIVLDNVLFINSKEDALKRLMSRMEVRITTDQETAT